jgi:glycine betaine/choline ABC-type transport system substrate-binding protein
MVRSQALTAHPGLEEVLAQMAGTLTTATMQKLNEEVDGQGERPSAVAERWIEGTKGEKTSVTTK